MKTETTLKNQKEETIYKPILGATRYEVSELGIIRSASNKRKIIPDKKGNIVIYNDNGKKIITDIESAKQNTGESEKTDLVTNEEPPKSVKKEVAPTQSTNVSEVDVELKNKIKSLHCLKHQRIFLLTNAGVDKKEAMVITRSNAGEVYNAIKAYKDNTQKQEAALALLKK